VAMWHGLSKMNDTDTDEAGREQLKSPDKSRVK